MKKLIASLLLIVLVVPGLAWAQEGKGSQQRRRRKASSHETVEVKLKQVGGKIVSLSANTVTLTTRAASKDKKTKAKHVRVRISDKGRMRLLLARGLGQKAQLFCRKTDKGRLVLVRIKSIEGVEIAERGRRRPGMRGEMQRRGKELSPEEFEKVEKGRKRALEGRKRALEGQKRALERYRAIDEHLRENPELRRELRELAEKDPEAFRRRIRQIHEARAAKPGDKPRRDWARRKPGQASRDGARPEPPRRGGDRGRGRPGNLQVARLEQQSQELAKQYRQAKGRNKEKLDDKLRNTLTEAFELKVEAQTKQIERMEKQLEKLHEQLEKRERNREAMIQKRFSQLTGQEDELSW